MEPRIYRTIPWGHVYTEQLFIEKIITACLFNLAGVRQPQHLLQLQPNLVGRRQLQHLLQPQPKLEVQTHATKGVRVFPLRILCDER